MFSIVQDITHIGQQGDFGLYFGPNSPQSPGDIQWTGSGWRYILFDGLGSSLDALEL